MPPLIVVGTVQVAHAIALEATLSFLGLGLPVTEPSLGLLIANGYEYLLSGKYWISVFPGVALLIRRSVGGTAHADHGGIDTVAKEFFEYTTDEDKFLCLGIEKVNPKGLEMGYFPDSALFPLPVVTLIYNEGSKALIKVMLSATVEHITAHGYSKFWAMNATGKSYKAWIRACTPIGTTGPVIGSHGIFHCLDSP